MATLDRGDLAPQVGPGLLEVGEQAAHLGLELEQVLHGVVTVDEVDHPALVGHLVALEGELRGVGVANLDPEVLVDVAGQLALLVRARYLVDAVGYHQVRGLPQTSGDLAEAIVQLVKSGSLDESLEEETT